jgi:arylsulfatase A-like enzyme
MEKPAPDRPGSRRRRWLGALAVLLPHALAACSAPAPPPDAPNVVLITLESLRTDHVGAYGGGSRSRPEVPVTPAIDAFAGEATVYEDAHAVTSWTLASHASLFTGLYPTGHQTDGPLDRLDDSYPTLAETLARRGYQTVGIVSGPYLRRMHNLHQGFELYEDSFSSLIDAVAHDDVTNPSMEAALRRFIDHERELDRPFFLFAYFWDPHYDFLPPAPYDEMFIGPGSEPIDMADFDKNSAIHRDIRPGQLAYLFSQYAGELRWTDEHLGRFFRLLMERGLWENTLLILTADHGEEFFDHGEKGHKNNVYAETVRVPLIVKYPGQKQGERDDRLVSLVDLLPTVLDVTRTEVSFPLHGRSLRAIPAPAQRPIYFELLSTWYLRGEDGRPFARRRRWYGVREGDYKLVWSESDEASEQQDRSYELFNVRDDPVEQVDLSARDPAKSEALARALEEGMGRSRQAARRYRRGGKASLSEEERERLRALGYLDR